MIQFNLLPDVKIAFIKAQRQKRLVITASIIASSAAVALFILLFTFVHGVQKKSMSDLTKDIKTHSKELTDTPQLNEMLTVQNQLNTLDQLHGDKVVASRLFEYLHKVTPTNVGVSELKIDYTAYTMEISGGAPSLAAVNTYADSLKYAKFTAEGDTDQKPAFKDVVLSSFNVSLDKGPQYTFMLGYDPALFAQDQKPQFTVQKTGASQSGAANTNLFQQNGGR